MLKPKENKSNINDIDIFKKLPLVKDEIRDLYLADDVPWVIGYSGGKDSTVVVQLVWLTLLHIESKFRKKPIYVISTDTLVENPIVASWASRSLELMRKTAKAQDLPIYPKLLVPDIKDSFWVNLIGKGYPAPRPKFRWCTERLKIKPATKFIQSTINKHGEVILLIGARTAESQARAKSIERRKSLFARERLTAHVSLTNCLVYTPIEDWNNDDVWLFLLQIPNQWGCSHKDLFSLYRGATTDGECPLVTDTSTPSCGNSRFGCWVCTLVDQDKSMAAMIQNDDEKEWMLPLLELRNELDFRSDEARKKDRTRRDFRRLSGQLSYYKDKTGVFQLVPGPYKQEAREYWLRRLLRVQRKINDMNSIRHEVQKMELISFEELQEIRRVWVVEKHEIEDTLPKIYEDELGIQYPQTTLEEDLVFNLQALELLKNLCSGDELKYELARNLLDIERCYRTKGSRQGLYKELESAIKRCFFENVEDATKFMELKSELQNSKYVSEDGTLIDQCHERLK